MKIAPTKQAKPLCRFKVPDGYSMTRKDVEMRISARVLTTITETKRDRIGTKKEEAEEIKAETTNSTQK